MNPENLSKNIQNKTWLADNIVGIKPLIRKYKLDDYTIVMLWQIDELHTTLINNQNFSPTVIQDIAPQLSSLSPAIFSLFLKTQPLNDHLLHVVHDILPSTAYDLLLVLWESYTPQLYKLNSQSLVEMVRGGYITYTNRSLIHILENNPQVLTPDLLYAIIQKQGLPTLELLVKRIFFVDETVDYMILFWRAQKNGPPQIPKYIYRMIKRLIYYNHCSLHKKAEILLIS